MDLGTPRLFRWDEVAEERVTDRIRRRVVTGERVMVARIWLDRGCVVPRHAHEAEQLSWVFSGGLKFVIAGETIDVRAGDLLWIPSQIPHEAVALDDTYEMDVFSPIRHDWLTGTDGYFHQPATQAPEFSNPASAANPATLFRWADLAVEAMSESIHRAFLSGDRATIARIELRQGAVVPTHAHESEQITWVRSGALELSVAGVVYRVPAGSVLRIPSNLPHRAEALEDSEVVDLFSPRREDWIARDDQYLRQAQAAR
jgi:quercetin dioxygenase-like cupin family protein